MDNSYSQRILVKKILLIGLFVFVLIISFRYIITTSRLSLTNASKVDVVVLLRSSSKNYEQKIDMKAGEKKTMTVKKSRYIVEVASDDKQSMYSIQTGNLWQTTSLAMEVSESKASTFLGKSTLDCGRQINNQPVYYSCDPSSAGFIESGGNINLSPQTEGEVAPGKEIVENNSTLSLKPFGDHFLEAKKVGNNLFISKRDQQGYVRNSSIKISDFKTDIRDGIFAVDEALGMYAALDTQSKTVTYGSVDKKEQKKLNTSSSVSEESSYEYSIELSQNKLFLVASLSSDFIEIHEGDEDTHDEPNAKSAIFVFNTDDGKEVKKIGLRKNSIVSNISSGGGNFVYSTNTEDGKGGSVKLIDNNLKENDIEGFEISRKPCWINDSSFYYQSDENNIIYRYSLDKKAAYLVYKNNSSEDFINKLSCANNNLYFSINSMRDGQVDVYDHYILSNNPQIGRPLEEAFPRYFEVDDNDYKASLVSANRIKVELLYDAGGNGPSDQNKTRSVLFDDLEFEQINTKNLIIEY